MLCCQSRHKVSIHVNQTEFCHCPQWIKIKVSEETEVISLKCYWKISHIYINHFLLLAEFRPSKYNSLVFHVAIPLHFLGLSSLNSTPLFCPEDPSILSFKKGDLLIFTEDKRLDADPGWIGAQNERTGKTGNVFLEDIYIIPSLTKPSSQVLVRKANTLREKTGRR